MSATRDLFVETETFVLFLACITAKNRLPVPLPLERGIYRSQLRNLFPEVGALPALADRSVGGGVQESKPWLRVVLGLSRASAQLAAYLEPREHGAASPVSHIQEAMKDLHTCAEALAAAFVVDLARAHRARLEALLGAPLPASLIEQGQAGRATERRV